MKYNKYLQVGRLTFSRIVNWDVRPNLSVLAKMHQFVFQNLPSKVVGLIFEHLSYADLARVRSVDRWFGRICNERLGSALLELRSSIDRAALLIANETNRISSSFRFCNKLIRIASFEAQILFSTVGRYVQLGVYRFAGGKLLDIFHRQIELITYQRGVLDEQSFEETSRLVMRLFLLNHDFVEHFEEAIEPRLLAGHPSSVIYGTKLVDLLDAYLLSNFHVEASSVDEETCQIYGRYEILLTRWASPPPLIELDSAYLADTTHLSSLLKYFRNQVRWNNLFYCLESDSLELPSRKSRKLCLNCSAPSGKTEQRDVFHHRSDLDRVFSRWSKCPASSENISYTIELECSNFWAPLRLDPDLGALKGRSRHNFAHILREISSKYEFYLVAKITLPTSDYKVSVENSIELYHDSTSCFLTQNSKEMRL